MSINSKLPLIILTGPTGVGKTELSIKLAKELDGEIISADSIQVYKYMDIGSAKIMPDEMQGVEHHLINFLEPDEEFNIFLFKEYAKAAMDKIYAKGKIPIIAGGTGFYIQSVLYDIEFNIEEDENKEVRSKYMELAKEHGNAYVHKLLEEIDPESAATIHANNLKRVIRAIEYYEHSGEKISEHNKREAKKTSPYDFHYFVLNRNRDVLYQRINDRVDIMIKNGLVDEVRKLLDMGYSRDLTSMQGIGYKEIVEYLEDEITLEEAIQKIKLDTRHFAKRQLTWFRREKTVTMLNYEDFDDNTDKICEYIIKKVKNIKNYNTKK